jgi:homoserine dehydrogenase
MVSVAILGFGVVGSGVAEVLSTNSEKIAHNAGQEIGVKYILDVRDFPDSPYKDRLVKDFSII